MDRSKINIISDQGQILETGGRRKFCLIMEGKIKEYEKRMLSESGCPFTLPMNFISEDGKDMAYYDFTGHVRLENYIKQKLFVELKDRETGKPLCETLKMLSGILECLKGMERYLFYPERYSIHPDVIFVDLNSGRISIAFYPDDNSELTLQERIIMLIDRMNGFCCDNDTDNYLSKLKSAIDGKNPGLDGLISLLGIMRREAGYIYWNPNALREAEGSGATEKRDIENQTGATRKKTALLKSAAVHAVFAAVLTAVLLMGILDHVSFAGLAVIAAGADIGIVRRFHFL